MTFATASGTMAPAYHGRMAEATFTKACPLTIRTTSGPSTDKLIAPSADNKKVPRSTMFIKSLFSFRAAL